MKPAISVHNLSKEYRLGLARTRNNNLTENLRYQTREIWDKVSRLFSPNKGFSKEESFWALKDVSFEVKPGEVVGIIGRNGAGKSTLLKVLSKIVEPTSGHALVRGRMGSLLEVGTGFHPELTGRENIYLNGAILGMKREEISRKFDEIVAFAEVDRFLDTPVKRYSSGMYVRLAFSVAAHLEPEILVIDEVLAVGDEAFQRKCLGLMNSVAKHGRTIVFVSHNMTAIQQLCSRSIIVASGRIAYDGLTMPAIKHYLNQTDELEREWVDARKADPEKRIMIQSVRISRIDGEASAIIFADQPFEISVGYEVYTPVTAQIAFRINRDDGLTVLTTADCDQSMLFCRQRKLGRYLGSVKIPGHFLAPGRYQLLVAANLIGNISADVVDSVLHFEINSTGSLQQLEGRQGVIMPILGWHEVQLT